VEEVPALYPVLPRLRLMAFCVVFQWSAVEITSNWHSSRIRSELPPAMFWGVLGRL
jgi:hypothetical protein